MPCRLRAQELVTIRVLAEKLGEPLPDRESHGGCEGTVRYHLRRAAAGAEGGRRPQPRRVEGLVEMIRV
jgi:hypothetical protein